LTDGSLVLRILLVWPRSFNNSTDFIDFAMQSTSRNESRELTEQAIVSNNQANALVSSRLVTSRHVTSRLVIPIQKVTRNTKGLRHGLELNTLVRLQQLGIGQDSHFAHEIARVRADEPIVLDAIRDERCNIGPMAGCTTGALVLMIRAPCGDSDFGGAMPHERLGIGNNIPRAPKNSLYSLLYNEFRNDERCGISRMTDKTSGASMTFSRRRGRSSDRMLVMTA
jgi:hypothetical protein